MKLPTIKHPTNRPNFTVVTLEAADDREMWLAFSYETCIGFMRPSWKSWILRQNVWGPTTGKHMNALNADHKDRWNEEEFQWMLEGMLTGEVAGWDKYPEL
jgi:hypothetical protein